MKDNIYHMTHVPTSLTTTLVMLALIAPLSFSVVVAEAEELDLGSPSAGLERATSTSDLADATSSEDSIDPVTEPSGQGAVLGISTDVSRDPVLGDSVDGVVLGETVTEEGMTPVDPIAGGDDKENYEVDNQRVVTAALNVRISPAVLSESLGVVHPGTKAVVLSDPVEYAGYTWLYVSYETGLSGWSVATWLQ